jgi:signal transduction histidine kinase
MRDISQLTGLDRARNSLIDNISHQLRTPLATMKLYAHLMQQNGLSRQDQRSLEIITSQIEWLQHLVQDVVEMTALDSGKAITTWAPVSVPGVVDEIRTRFAKEAAAASLDLRVSPVAETLPDAVGDEARLVQAVSEIVDNAVRFTPAGGTVALSAASLRDGDGTWVKFTVTDTGPGIPANEQARVFDRFFRGSITDPGQIPGTGLGLSIARTIILAHGGRITFESQPGGTSFEVWLPVTDTCVVPLAQRGSAP